MIDLGDTVALAWPHAPVTATAVTVTVTQPDATVAGPFTAAYNYGSYAYRFAPTQVGRHAVRWLATGPDVEAYSDAFDVADADPGFIISLDDAKKQLKITRDDSTEELRTWLGATTDVVEHYVGAVVARTYTEVHNGGGIHLTTYHAPIISVAAITEFIGTTVYALTNQPVGQSVNPYGFTVDNALGGIITRRTSASLPSAFMPGVGNITITYTAGRPSIPYAIQAAARLIVQHLWTTRRGAMPLPGPGGAEVSVVPGIGYAVPTKAVELLERYQRVPGIA